ncbi:hypothetical protein JCM3770_005583 [Rhodotorula araucariae]
MGRKRAHTPELDLTLASSSDSDASPMLAAPPHASTSSSSRATRAKTNKEKMKRSSSPDADADVPPHVRTAHASAFLAPRSRLFGGTGTGVEDRPRVRATGSAGGEGKGKGKARDEDDEVPRYKAAALPDATLPFALLVPETPQTSGRQRTRLEYAEPVLLVTTKVKEKRGRKPGKKKKKKRAGSDSDLEDAEDDSPSDDIDDDDRVDLDSVVGRNAGQTTVRALVAAPTVQMPWIPNRFATLHLSSPRKKRKTIASDDDDDKPKKQHATRLFKKNGDVPLLVVHGEPLDEDVKLGSAILAHQPNVEISGDKEGSMHAGFFVITRRMPPSKRHHLRLAVCTADGTEASWKKPENAIWLQDFPQFPTPVPDPAANPTHTPFSSALLTFLSAPQLGLAAKAKYRAHLAAFGAFDFASSADIRLVTSLAGTFVGEDKLAHGGGLDSLAVAMSALAANPRGKWKIEYLTATTDRVTQALLEQLHAAVQGVPPHEYKLQTTTRAQSAANGWRNAADQTSKAVIAYPTLDELERAAGKSKEEHYHVLRQAVMKSGRLNHANMMLIIRAPLQEDKVDDGSHREQYEAFLLVGSHTPTLASWGSYDLSSDSAPKVTLAQHDLSVVYRCAAAPTWSALLQHIAALVPYERPLKPYGDDDEPAPTAPPRPPRKKAGRKKNEDEGQVSD